MIDLIDDIEEELLHIKVAFDFETSCFIKALQTFSERLERAERWIDELKNRTLN